ncbi:MAG: hypothetical protein FVQ83_13235 [Chloroflexi bacterium]|nr:hypothetical protein [Chloroflexota bacterium]
MISKKQIALAIGLALAYVIFAWSASANKVRREDNYTENLGRVLDQVILLNVTLANQMVVQRIISEEALNEALTELDLLQQEFELLGPAPKELDAAANALDESIQGYMEAYLFLAEQDSNSTGFQVDSNFLELAMHAGEQTHLSTQLLFSREQSSACIGAQRLLPKCWLW